MKKRKSLSHDKINELISEIGEGWNAASDLSIKRATHSKNISINRRGTKISEEHRLRISEGNKKKRYSEESRKKLSEAQVRRWATEESRMVLSMSQRGPNAVKKLNSKRPTRSRLPVSVKGVEYASATIAAQTLGLPYSFVRSRVLSDLAQYSDYFYLEKDISVSIDNVVYESISAASLALNIHYATLNFRIRSQKERWKDYFFIDKEANI